MEKMENLNKLAEAMNESTDFSWLWCFLFGPLWFAFIGSWKWFFISILANLATLGVAIIIMPLFAYKAHREVAMSKALSII